MKKVRYQSFLRGLFVVVNLVAAVSLAVGVMTGVKSGYSRTTWEDVFLGKTYLESEQYQQQASEAVYDVLSVAARSTRFETDGEYDPDRIIRIRDYLDTGEVYDSVSESDKKNGICYRLGDLYQWSIKGLNSSDGVLQESFAPLFYGSIQEYANDCGEEYNVLVTQIQEAAEQLQSDVAQYQKEKKEWASSAVNVRYLLLDLGSENICTNVSSLQREDVSAEELESYFRGFGSYYIFDSRTSDVEQQNIGDYFSYNTHALLTSWGIHLDGEYLVYVGIDTDFPVADQMAAGQQEYLQAKETLSSCIGPVLISAVILLVSFLWLLWKAAGVLSGLAADAMESGGAVFRVCVFFAGYELLRWLLLFMTGDSMTGRLCVALYMLAVLMILIWDALQRQRLLNGVQAMADGEPGARISEEHLSPANRRMAEAVNHLGEGLGQAMEEQMKSERMKADLITNVSHDLKTPLTSIINYVDLMKREPIDNPKAQEYLTVLDQKSQRLRQLTEDLVEASRASSGNVTLDMQKLDLKELLMQTSGEFEERFAARGLTLMPSGPEYPLYIEADGRRLWRILENLFRNVEKYAMPHTRVYLDMECDGHMASVSLKNISEQPLNISAEELTERFVRGDEARTTEGSGLGLSIAKDLTELQHGTFSVYLDGDLFKVTVAFPWIPAEELREKEN